MKKRKLNQLSINTLWHIRNTVPIGLLIIGLFVIVILMITQSKVPQNLSLMIAIFIILISYTIVFLTSNAINSLLNETLDSEIFQKYYQINHKKYHKKRTKIFLMTSQIQVSFYKGNFNFVEDEIHRLLLNYSLNNKEKIILSIYLFQTLCFKNNQKDSEKISSLKEELIDIASGSKQYKNSLLYIFAVEDIIYHQKENSFFESYQPTSKLARLMSDFYKAKIIN
ncbi:hypothetical protein [Streptococcus sp. CSL10205-OR2]|uniref:hypothetical protein n=1 Tax=Streptococcus sp. CSL10205-OR2 TaxID=2980558 RepID=UPI0021D806AC|nr:hypothetical protein [Streptococcus sp. CSL10205-OR2]MCU9533317.1 hypothetical protein [Streptococcus sp. CSL10205-OR2]